jgi:mRNA interferase MazF
MTRIRRGEIWWADLGTPRGSGPGLRRPALVIQANSFNASSIQTVIIAVITGNTSLAEAPGNVFLPSTATGLPRDSVVNVSQLITIGREYLLELQGTLPSRAQAAVDDGLRLALQL